MMRSLRLLTAVLTVIYAVATKNGDENEGKWNVNDRYVGELSV